MAVFITGGGVKPSAIDFVNYIQSSGSEYVDTGLKVDSSTKIVCDMELLSTSNVPYPHIFGARSSNAQGIKCYYASGWTALYGSEWPTLSAPSGGRHLITIEPGKFSIDSASATFATASFSVTPNLLLFAGNEGETVSYISIMRLYAFSVYSGSSLIAEYLPCRDKNGVYCLYDTVSQSYKYNSGSGSFTGG